MDKEGKKDFSLFGIFVLGVIFLMVFVFAVTTLNLPIASGNYSGTFEIDIIVDANVANNMTNVTCYYNSSGGPATTFLVEILNETVSNLNFTDDAISISSFTDSLSYNISCNVYNGTTLNQTISVLNITFDNTPPSVFDANISSPLNFGNYSSSFGILYLNVSFVDDTIGIDTVYFNITNSTGSQFTIRYASNSVGSFWNSTLNLSAISGSTYDGIYNYTVWANDSLGNLNNSAVISATLDNTNPVVSSFTCTPASVSTGATVTCSCSGTDTGGTGVLSTSYTANPSSTAIAGTFTETCNVIDYAGNSITSTTSYIVTSGGGSPAVGSTGPTWTMTYNIPEDNFVSGYSKAMKVKERMKFKVGEEYHHVGIKSITSSKVVVEIASEPVTLELDVGEDAKVDLDDDKIYDLYVILNSIEGGKADITVQELDEVVPEGVEGGVETSGDVVGDEGVVGDEERGNWWIAIIVILLIAAAAGGGAAWKKRR